MAKVFAVPSDETGDGYHHVNYTRGNNLNRGKTRKFRKWRLAVKFAKEKAKELGCQPLIHLKGIHIL